MKENKRFSKCFLDKLRDHTMARKCFFGFIGVGANYNEAILETAKFLNIEPEYDNPNDKPDR